MAGGEVRSRKGRTGSLALPAGGWSLGSRLPLDASALRHTLSGWITLEIDRRRPFLWLPVCFGLGVIAYFKAESEPGLTAPVLAILLCLASAAALRRSFGALALFLAAACFFSGFAAGVIRTQVVAAPVLARAAFLTVEGRIETIDWNGQGGRMVVRLQDVSPAIERMPERVRLTFRGRPALTSGDGIRLKARLSPPSPAAVPGGFDFQREAWFQRLGAVGFVTGAIAAAPELPPMPLRGRIAAAIDAQRNALTQRIIDVVGGATGAISAALVTGKRGMIPENDNEAWRAAGIYHIVSISGLHMVLAAGLFFWGARMALMAIPGLALRRPIKKWAALFAMLGAIAYDVFSGSEVATERSLIMTLVMFGAILFDRPALAMRNLALAGLIVMTLEPETLLGPSFQMSFGAVAGLVAWGEWERLRRASEPVRDRSVWSWLPDTLWRPAVAVLLTTLIAGLATAPFQAYHFHRLNPYGVLGNALAIPLCSFVVMPAALLGVVLLPFGLDAPVWWAMGQGVAGIQTFATWVAGIDGSVAVVRRFGAAALAVMAFGLATLTLMSVPALRCAGLILVGCGALWAGRADRPALIIDSSGRTAMVRGSDGKLILTGPQRPAFAIAQWLPGDLDARAPKDPALTKGAACDKSGCVSYLADGRAVAVVIEPAAFAEDCERAAIIITPLVAPMACRDHAEVYDRDYLETFGATYLYAEAKGFRHETARNERYDRPWAPARGRKTVSTPPETAPSPQPMQPWDSQSPDGDGP